MDPIILLFIGLAVIFGSILILKLHLVLALLFAAILVGILTSADNLIQFAQLEGFSTAETSGLIEQPVGERIAEAFGDTASKIGVLIAMAAIIQGGYPWR